MQHTGEPTTSEQQQQQQLNLIRHINGMAIKNSAPSPYMSIQGFLLIFKVERTIVYKTSLLSNSACHGQLASY